MDTDWGEVTRAESVDNSWKAFQNKFINALDEVAPIKEVRIRHSSQPWMTPEILEMIKDRDFKKTLNKSYHFAYCKLRNLVQRLIRETERTHLINKINENRHNPKKFWKIIKDLGYKQMPKNESNITLKIDNNLCNDPKITANHFNSFFTNVATELVTKLPHKPNVYTINSKHSNDYYGDDVNEEFLIQPVNEEFIRKEIISINISKSTGPDGIPARFLRDASDIIASPTV